MNQTEQFLITECLKLLSAYGQPAFSTTKHPIKLHIDEVISDDGRLEFFVWPSTYFGEYRDHLGVHGNSRQQCLEKFLAKLKGTLKDEDDVTAN